MMVRKLLVLVWIVALVVAVGSCDGGKITPDDDDDDNGDLDSCTWQGCPCEKNLDCDAGCYCSEDFTCLCTDDDDDLIHQDGDNTDDDDDNNDDTCTLIASPVELDYGSVILGSTMPKTLTLSNPCGEEVSIFDIRFAANTEPPNAECTTDDFDDFTLMGETPSEANPIVLLPNGSTEIQLTYTPNDPGTDCILLLIPTSLGLLEVPVRSREKGTVKAEICCEKVSDEAPAGHFGLVSVDQLNPSVMMCKICNNPPDEDSNKVLVIPSNGINLSDTFDGEFQLDYSSINYNDNNAIWLAPDQCEEFNITYLPRDQGEDAIDLEIQTNDPEVSNPLLFSASTCEGEANPEDGIAAKGVVADLEVSPNPINFWSVPVGESHEIGVRLSNRGQAPLQISVATIENDTLNAFELNLDPDMFDSIPQDGVPNIGDTIAPLGFGDWTGISVTCTPQGQYAYPAILHIESNSYQSSSINVTLSCTGITSELGVRPRSIDFGCVRVGDSSPVSTVYVSNYGAAPLEILGSGFSGTPIFYEANGIPDGTVLDGGSAPLEVEIYCQPEPGMDGIYTGQYLIHNTNGDTVAVELQCCAMSPLQEITPNLVEFSDVQMAPADLDLTNITELERWQECQTVTIANTGSEKLTVSPIDTLSNLAGEANEQFTIDSNISASEPINPDMTRSFEVCYLPTQVGGATDSIAICSDALNGTGGALPCTMANHTMTTIPIYANSIDPRLFVEPWTGSYDWGTLLPGDQETKQITISNTGSGPLTISEIARAGGSSLDFEITAITPSNAGIPQQDGTYILDSNDESIVVDVLFAPSSQGPKFGAIEIHHDDKDAARLGAPAGTDRDIFLFSMEGGAIENHLPKAIVKSPTTYPAGPYGSRTRTIEIGEVINLSGEESYDTDDDEATPQEEDYIIEYAWEIADGPSGGATFTGVTSGADAAYTSARFDLAGTYTVSLRVKDSRNDWSTDTMDSQLMVKVMQKPLCIASQCDTGSHSIEVFSDEPICLDGRDSRDDDGSISEYRWYVRQQGSTNEVNVGLAQMIDYTFTQSGNYVIRLETVDNEGNTCENLAASQVNVEVSNYDRIRVELHWTGGGDVNLHWLRPNGTLDSMGDCNPNRTRPDWTPYGCGHPVLESSSDNGYTPESMVHDDPDCGGEYKIIAEYVEPTQSCHTESDCRTYNENCEHCGCKDSFGCSLVCWTGWVGNCCRTCEVCGPVQVCEDIPAQPIVSVYINGSSTAKYTVTGRTLNHAGDKATFSISRSDGKFLELISQ